jgi:hypothetical protein
MSNFNSQEYSRQLINERKLIQIYGLDGENYDVGFIFYTDNQVTVYSSNSSTGSFDGVCLMKNTSIGIIKTDTIYLQKFAQRAGAENLYQQAQQQVSVFNKHSWNNWLETAMLQKIPVTLKMENGHEHDGIIINFNPETILMYEYSSHTTESIGQTSLGQDNFSTIIVGSGWLTTMFTPLKK